MNNRKCVCVWLWVGVRKNSSSAPMSMNVAKFHIQTHVSSSWHFDRCRHTHAHILWWAQFQLMYHITVIWRQIYTVANKNKNVNFHLIELIGGFQVVWCGEKFTQRHMNAGIIATRKLSSSQHTYINEWRLKNTINDSKYNHLGR